MLIVSQIHKSYNVPEGKLKILQDISFELEPGVFMAIVGESGSGKSTLLQILGSLDHPDSGEVSLNGHLLQNLNEQQLAQLRNQHIGFVYQSHHLIAELSAIENVMLPLLIQGKSETYARKQAKILLDELGLADRESHSPAHLSGGEAQRVAVARAIINKPSLILADEPTGNLDESTAHTVFSLIRDVCQKHMISVIMVTHSQSFANACDKVYELENHELTLLESKNH